MTTISTTVSTTTDPAPVEEKTETVLTKYRVLTSVDGTTEWALVGRASGHGQEAALKQFFGENAPPVLAVAVPERSFRPVWVGSKTVPTFTPVSLDGDEDVDDEPDEGTA